MNYLLDTNVVSYFMERRPSIKAKVREVGGLSFLSISTITLAELNYGIRIMPEGRKRTRRLNALDQILRTGIDARPFSIDAAAAYPEARATLEEAGIGFTFPDLAIASIAIAENKSLSRMTASSST